MKILSKHKWLSPAPTAGPSFYNYTTNNDNAFQHYRNLELFEKQLAVGNSKGLVVYEHPAHSVASAIMDGNFDNAPLQDWIHEAKNSLAVIRRHRRNMLVVERDATDEQVFRSAFSAAFTGHKPPQEIAPRSPKTQTLKLLLALFAVRQYRPVAQLLGELEASSIAAANELPLDDTLRVAAKEMQELLERDQASKAELQKLEAENRRIALEFEAEKQTTKSRNAEANETLMRQILDLKANLQQLDRERNAAEQRALEAERKHQAAEQEVAGLKTTISRIHRSTSWRLTAPVRAIKTPFSR